MAENSKIEWTDHTFNPWIGCTAISPACDHCYAEDMMDRRFGKVSWGPHGDRALTSGKNWNMPLRWNREAAAAGKRARVFCASLADVFDNHASIQPVWRRDLWRLIEATPHLDWLLLTKRPQNVRRFVPNAWMEDGFPSNVWLGISVENQEQAAIRIPPLLSLPVDTTFLSMEPLVGPVDLTEIERPAKGGVHVFNALECDVDPEDDEWEGRTVSWVIAGGESGPKARPSNPQWFRDLRDQCAIYDTPFLFKQWGEWVSVSEIEGDGPIFTFPDGRTVRRAGKSLAGRTLDGVLHDGVPGRA